MRKALTASNRYQTRCAQPSGLLIANSGKDIAETNDMLFMQYEAYTWRLWYQLPVNICWISWYQVSAQACHYRLAR